jgi:tetratricopeptide (TPR) repeat protein
MTDDARQPLGDFINRDPAVRDAAIAGAEALLQQWPPSDDPLTDVERGLALWKIGEALFRSRRMQEAADRLDEAERTLSRVPELGIARAAGLSTRAGALAVLKRYREARDVATHAIQLAAKVELKPALLAGWSARALSAKALGEWREASFAADGLLTAIGDDPPAKHRSSVTRALLTKAWAARMAGQPEIGLALVEQAITRAHEDDARELLCEILGERAELLYSAGHRAAAITAYEELIAGYGDSSEDYAREAVIVAHGRRWRWKALSRFGLRSSSRKGRLQRRGAETRGASES